MHTHTCAHIFPRFPLLATVKRQKIARFWHVTRHDSFSKTILQGTLDGGQSQGQQRKCWMDIKDWRSLPVPELLASRWPPAEKTGRGSLLNRPSCPHSTPTPMTQLVKGLNWTGVKLQKPQERRWPVWPCSWCSTDIVGKVYLLNFWFKTAQGLLIGAGQENTEETPFFSII